jgi:hypothetical protein
VPVGGVAQQTDGRRAGGTTSSNELFACSRRSSNRRRRAAPPCDEGRRQRGDGQRREPTSDKSHFAGHLATDFCRTRPHTPSAESEAKRRKMGSTHARWRDACMSKQLSKARARALATGSCERNVTTVATSSGDGISKRRRIAEAEECQPEASRTLD